LKVKVEIRSELERLGRTKRRRKRREGRRIGGGIVEIERFLDRPMLLFQEVVKGGS